MWRQVTSDYVTSKAYFNAKKKKKQKHGTLSLQTDCILTSQSGPVLSGWLLQRNDERTQGRHKEIAPVPFGFVGNKNL